MKHVWILLAACVMLVGCRNEADEPPMREPDYIRLEDGVTDFEAPAEGGELNIRFSTNAGWKVEFGRYSEGSIAGILQKKGDEGDNEVTAVVLPNVRNAERIYRFSLVAGRASVEISITQKPMEIDLPEEAEVRRYLMRLYNEAGGPDWRVSSKWGSDLPINDWGPEVRYEKGRLKLYLSDRNIKGKLNLSGCKALEELRCSKNQISEIDVSGCPLLTYIDATNVGLQKINLDGCLMLSRLSVSYNPLSDINIKDLTSLTEVFVHNCNLSSLDLERCTWLRLLECYNNCIRTINIPRRDDLVSLHCYANNLTSLDLSDASQLQMLNCGENQLTDLNVRGCRRLSSIYCYVNRLKSVDVSDQKNVLSAYYCFSNRFGKLNLEGYRNLSELHCSDNGLTSLNIAGCRNIRWLYCSHNKLDELDISAPDREIFERLDCSYNRMQKIDITSITKGLRIWCQGNRIGGEIPEHFDRLLEFEYDVRYEYNPDSGTYTDRGYGWWYPGEPEKMQHCR